MTDERAFLQAVIADPDDDAPRLIYADWLDENGQSERAEFIRVQIALYGLSKTDDPERFTELRRRERQLKRRYSKMWTEPLRPIAIDGSFVRGFVEGVAGDARAFVTRGEVLFLLAPIRHLLLMNAGYCALPLSQCPYLYRPLALSLNGLRDRDVYHLANSRFLGRLAGLALEYSQITDVGAMHLARSPYLGSLDDLHLKGYTFSRETRTALRHRFGSRVHF